MIAVRLLWLAVLLVAIPAWVGNCFLNVDKPCRNPVFLWISGQMLLWAGFQVICVPVILLEGRMWMVTVAYCGYILCCWQRQRSGISGSPVLCGQSGKQSRRKQRLFCGCWLVCFCWCSWYWQC